jgi:hypothetical protein
MNMALDKASAVLRVVSVVGLLPYAFWVLISGHWRDRSHLLALGAALAFGMLLYHLLTSVRRCHNCGLLMTNFGIGSAAERGKRFTCPRCGEHVVSPEGFVWFREFTG